MFGFAISAMRRLVVFPRVRNLHYPATRSAIFSVAMRRFDFDVVARLTRAQFREAGVEWAIAPSPFVEIRTASRL